MSMRKVPFPVGQWTDIAAAASPALVSGESYFLNWFENTIAYLSLTYGDDPPPTGDLGTKFFANNSPQVGTGGFSIPQSGKVWNPAAREEHHRLYLAVEPSRRRQLGALAHEHPAAR